MTLFCTLDGMFCEWLSYILSVECVCLKHFTTVFSDSENDGHTYQINQTSSLCTLFSYRLITVKKIHHKI